MSKDPAFLMYSKDWLEGTAEMLPEEKGVYIDLLCHQHQKGTLPSDTKRLARLSGLGHDEFLEIWENISPKFIHTDNRMVNQRLNQEVNRRSEIAKIKKISAVFAALIRKSGLEKSKIQGLKKIFNTQDFIDFPADEINQEISKWYNHMVNRMECSMVTSLVNHTETVTETVTKDVTKEGGMGETLTAQSLFAQDPLDKIKEELLRSDNWKDQVRLNLSRQKIKITTEDLDYEIESFIEMIRADGEQDKTLIDARKHFNRYIMQKLERSKSSKSKEKKEINPNEITYSE